jgi:hypothetical protein
VAALPRFVLPFTYCHAQLPIKVLPSIEYVNNRAPTGLVEFYHPELAVTRHNFFFFVRGDTDKNLVMRVKAGESYTVVMASINCEMGVAKVTLPAAFYGTTCRIAPLSYAQLVVAGSWVCSCSRYYVQAG